MYRKPVIFIVGIISWLFETRYMNIMKYPLCENLKAYILTGCTILPKLSYTGTRLMQTPLGPSQSILIRGVFVFQGLFYIHKISLGPHTVSALQWMPVFQGCSQGWVPLHMYIKIFLTNFNST